MARVQCEAGIKCLSCTEKQEGPTLVTRKCGHEFHISLRSKVRRQRYTKCQSGLPNLLLALSVSMTSAYSNLGVLQGFEPLTSATNSISLPLSHISCCPKAVPTMKKENIHFGKADLAAIVLLSVPLTWQNQYNLTHLMVPKSTRALLLDLEAIEWVMVENKNEKLKVKGKATSARPEVKSRSKRNASGGLSDQVPKKARSEEFCQHCKAHSAPYQTHNTLDCHCYDSNGKPLMAAAGKLSESKKSCKKFGGN
jgi:hypothetical protein